jgi:1-acyl-sn-glycerol-3-phosphate acyltransferase/long-chain acyl-CoA synthetase
LTITRLAPLPKGAFLICSNHRSHADSVVIMTAMDLPFQSSALLAAADYYFQNRVRWKIVSSMLWLIPIARRSSTEAFRSLLAKCDQALEHGVRAFIAYPEGGRKSAPTVAAFKRAPAAVAVRLGIPIVPVFLEGTDRLLPVGGLVPGATHISVVIGPPLWPPPARTGPDVRRASVDLTQALQQAVQALASEAATISAGQ